MENTEKIIELIKNEKLSIDACCKIFDAMPQDTIKAILQAFVCQHPEQIFGEDNVTITKFGQITIHNLHSRKTTLASMAMNSVDLPARH